jgi:ubiquitin C-terminal hydrolase
MLSKLLIALLLGMSVELQIPQLMHVCFAMKKKTWDKDDKCKALLYASVGVDKNTLALLWEKLGLRVYNSGICPFDSLGKDGNPEPKTAMARNNIYEKLDSEKKVDVSCALHLICELGKVKTKSIEDVYNDLKKFVYKGAHTTFLLDFIDGAIQYLEIVQGMIPEKVKVNKDSSNQRINLITASEKSMEITFGNAQDHMLLERDNTAMAIKALKHAREHLNDASFGEEIREIIARAMLLSPNIRFKFKDNGTKTLAIALEKTMDLAAHTEIQALVDHSLDREDKIIGPVLSTKLPCINCAMFLAYAKDKLFDKCTFVAVHSVGINEDNQSEYPWPFYWGLHSLEKYPNTMIPLYVPFIAESIEDISKATSENNFPFFRSEDSDSTEESKSSYFTESLSDIVSPESVKKMLDLDDLAVKEIATTKGSGIPEDMVGLTLFSNHCYANAAFQLLFACNPVREYITEYKGDDNFIKSIQILFKAMRDNAGKAISKNDEESKIGLQTIYKLIGQEATNGSGKDSVFQGLGTSDEQRDGSELLDNTISKTLPEGELASELKGEYGSSSHCSNCKKNILNDIQFNVLPVVLPENYDATNMTWCIEKTFAFEVIAGRKCSGCGNLINSNTIFKVKKLPDILIIQLKRFVFDKTLCYTRKKDNRVFYNKVLKFPKIVLDNESGAFKSEDIYYKLKGVIDHTGPSANNGHYTATILKEDGKWYTANGATITEQGNFECSKDTYVLMYEKETDNSKVKEEDYKEEDDSKEESGSSGSAQKKTEIRTLNIVEKEIAELEEKLKTLREECEKIKLEQKQEAQKEKGEGIEEEVLEDEEQKGGQANKKKK